MRLQTEQGCEPGEKRNTEVRSIVTWLPASWGHFSHWSSGEWTHRERYVQAFALSKYCSEDEKPTQYVFFLSRLLTFWILKVYHCSKTSMGTFLFLMLYLSFHFFFLVENTEQSCLEFQGGLPLKDDESIFR